MTQQSAIIIQPPEKDKLKKNRLRAVIRRKRLVLQSIVAKTEMLKVNLEIAKVEYMVRVGSLFLKDNQLDFEIIRLRNILELINDGYTYDEAVEAIAKKYYVEQLELEREKEELHREEEIYNKHQEHEPQTTGDLKKIWKKLIVKFHPDLIQDPEEKKKREVIMKEINRAYMEADLDRLIKIEQDHLVAREMTIDNLEEILARIIDDIRKQEEEFILLKKSEWFDWMLNIAKAKKKSIDIFYDTEKRLLDDIVGKFDLIKKLKQEIQIIGKVVI